MIVDLASDESEGKGKGFPITRVMFGDRLFAGENQQLTLIAAAAGSRVLEMSLEDTFAQEDQQKHFVEKLSVQEDIERVVVLQQCSAHAATDMMAVAILLRKKGQEPFYPSLSSTAVGGIVFNPHPKSQEVNQENRLIILFWPIPTMYPRRERGRETAQCSSCLTPPRRRPCQRS